MGAAQRQKLVVNAVDATDSSVELKSGVDQSVETFNVNASTRISIGGKKGTVDQIKPA